MRKFLLAAAAATAALSVAPSANATVVEGIQLSSTQVFDNFWGISAGTGAQSDTFAFSLDTASIFTTSVLTSTANAIKDLDFLSVDIDGVHIFSISNGIFSKATLSNVALAAGAHVLNVNYTTNAAGVTYSGDIAITPVAVPEPATWALMLAGIGAGGFVMRRRLMTARASLA